ncbi:MAG: 50S ribosomal protein L21 [Candidatus Aminicenantes bacterium]|nr:50S ribosomal protein L21 [Candidatus Aminicenantes bacterium]
MFAVIKTGGKQYRVKEGDILSVEKLEAEKGQTVDFDQVLLLEDGDSIQVGQPYLDKVVVKAEVIENYKDEKVIVFKKKRRKGYRRKKGHRQLLTKVKITGIYPDSVPVSDEKTEKEAAAKKSRKKAAEAGEEKLATKKATRRKKSETADKEEPAKEE